MGAVGDGAKVGSEVGAKVGTPVGLLVGAGEGLGVGADTGGAVVVLVGTRVGNEVVAFIELSFVGEKLGATVFISSSLLAPKGIGTKEAVWGMMI